MQVAAGSSVQSVSVDSLKSGNKHTWHGVKMLLGQDRVKKRAQASSMGPPQDASRCLPDVERVSSVVRGYREVSREPEMDTERQKQREKARPRLATQKLPTKAFTKSAPSFHSVNNRKWTGPGRTGHSHQQEAVKRPGGGKQQHLISLASAPWLPFILLFFTSLCSHPGGGGGGEYLYQSSSVMPGQQWVRGADGGRQTFIPPTAAPLLLIYHCHPLHLRRRPTELTDSWGGFPEPILAQICCCCW